MPDITAIPNDMSYSGDIVMCIDGTGSMVPVIDTVKNMALDFHTMLREALDLNSKEVKQLRIKVITFRDYNVDSEPMTEKGFYSLPDQNDEFASSVREIVAKGGGDEPENGLDALVKAMKSDWTETGWKQRHVIVLFTDASAKKFEEGEHPADMPKSLEELQTWWEEGVPGGNLKPSARRLVMFAPDVWPWNVIAGWNVADHYPSRAGEGCTEYDANKIIDKIVRSITIANTQ